MLKETIHSQQQQKARAREFSEETKFLSCLWLFGLLLKTEHMGKPWNNESILMPKPKKRGSDSFGGGGFLTFCLSLPPCGVCRSSVPLVFQSTAKAKNPRARKYI